MELKIILVIAVVVVCASCAEELRKKPSFKSLEMSNTLKLFSASTIQRCKAEDDDCITKAFNALVPEAGKTGRSTLIQRAPKIHSPFFVAGIPELRIPVLDNVFVKKQELTIGSNVLNIKITFTNSNVKGMAHGTVKSVKLVYKFRMTFPNRIPE